jgi:hypothetical protein
MVNNDETRAFEFAFRFSIINTVSLLIIPGRIAEDSNLSRSI